MTQQTYDANAVLMGGGGFKSWKFDEPGTTRTGTIAEAPQAKQEREYDKDNPGGGAPKFFPSGDPIMGITVVVQTTERDPSVEDDDGKRTFYVEGRYLKEAVREGVKRAGAPGLEVGGQLAVTFTHREDPMDKRSRKFWQVQYVPAANATLMADPAPQAPQQAAPPAWGQQAPAVPPPGFAQPAPAPAPVASVAPPVQYAAPPAAPAPAPAPANDEAAQLAAFQAWQASQGIAQPAQG